MPEYVNLVTLSDLKAAHVLNFYSMNISSVEYMSLWAASV